MSLSLPSPDSFASLASSLLAMLLLCVPASATPCGSCVDKVKVTITDGYLGEHYSLTFSSDIGDSASFTGASGSVELVPDVRYTLTADTNPDAGYCGDGKNDCWHISFNASCHQVEIDGTKTSHIDHYTTPDCLTTISWTFMLRSPASSGPPGSSSGPSASGSGINWTASAGGTLADGSHAGAFVLRKNGITADLFSPDSLLFQPTSTSVDEIDSGSGGHRQFVTPEGVFDIKALPQGQQGFELRFYAMETVGGIVAGYHTFTGDPIVIHRIDNPDPGNLTSARFTEIRDGAQKVQVLTPTSAGDTSIWTTVEGDGLRRTTRSRTPDGNTINEILTVETGEGQGGYTLESKTHTERHAFPWGWETTSTMRLIQADNGSDPDIWEHPTQYVYYGQDAIHPAVEGSPEYGKIKWTIQPDGSWAQYEYDDERAPGPTRIRRPWLNAPATPDLATDTVGHVIKRTYIRAPWGSPGTGSEINDFTEEETVHINGQEIRKTTWTAHIETGSYPASTSMPPTIPAATPVLMISPSFPKTTTSTTPPAVSNASKPTDASPLSKLGTATDSPA